MAAFRKWMLVNKKKVIALVAAVFLVLGAYDVPTGPITSDVVVRVIYLAIGSAEVSTSSSAPVNISISRSGASSSTVTTPTTR